MHADTRAHGRQAQAAEHRDVRWRARRSSMRGRRPLKVKLCARPPRSPVMPPLASVTRPFTMTADTPSAYW